LPLPFAIVLDGKEIGSITSMAPTLAGDSLALGMVRRSHFQSGTELVVDGRQATVLSIPE